jgi:hypothetical protein
MRCGLAVFILAIWALWGCKPDTMSAVPAIQFVSIHPKEVFEWIDSVTIRISYQDGDGDLGENDANTTNLWIRDLRINALYDYRIKQLAPNDASVPIQGNLDIVLPNTALSNSNNQPEQARFELYVEDRAGNRSNKVLTENITVKPL